ncbi:MAG TPA: hypothetical protein VGB92_13215 [Longimicrobium sp.]
MKHLLPNRQGFAADPFGYAALAWHRWALAQQLAGLPSDPERPPTAQDLKSPVLWLSQARALSEAATIVLQSEPNLDQMPLPTRGVCDSQYCAVGLMLVGYSLEVCLKAMLIIRKGIGAFITDERQFKHHRLEELAAFVPDLSAKDRAILRLLTDFVMWAGRYPDPGSGREPAAEAIFTTSEEHQIAALDLFDLARRVMQRAAMEIEESDRAPEPS